MEDTRQRPAVAVIGGGAVGRTFGRLLRLAGYPIRGVVCTSAAHAREAVRFIGAGDPTTDAPAAAQRAEIVLLSVPDDAIEPVAGTLQTLALVVHFCGNLPSRAAAAANGGQAGAIHPLRSFADPAAAAASFAGTFCFYEGDAPGRLRELIEACGGRPVAVAAEGKPLYHAGAVFASNYVVALLEVGLGLFERAGIPRAAAVEPLAELLSGTAENLKRGGPPGALTGPIARGEVGTVAAHLRRIEAADPELASLYRALGRVALGIARDRGGLSKESDARLARLLE